MTKKSIGLSGVLRGSLRDNLRQYTMFIALVGVIIIFSILDPTFLGSENLNNLLFQTAHIAVLVCGMILVIVAGHIDLSIGAVVGLTGAIAAIMQNRFDWGIVPAILFTLLVGMVIGLWQGFWVAYLNVPAFIVTLAGMMIFNGLLMSVTQGQTIYLTEIFAKIGSDFLPVLGIADQPNDTTVILWSLTIAAYILMQLKKRHERNKYEFENTPPLLFALKTVIVCVIITLMYSVTAFYRGVPYAVIITAIVGLIYHYLTNNTAFGRHVYAIGGNKEAARLSGVNIRMRTLLIFVSAGILGSIGGIMFTSRVGSAMAGAGKGMELEVIASAIIGGTSTLGGEGTIAGGIIGAFFMATLTNGMLLLGIPIEIRYVVNGLVLLFAVWLDVSSRKTAS